MSTVLILKIPFSNFIDRLHNALNIIFSSTTRFSTNRSRHHLDQFVTNKDKNENEILIQREVFGKLT